LPIQSPLFSKYRVREIPESYEEPEPEAEEDAIEQFRRVHVISPDIKAAAKAQSAPTVLAGDSIPVFFELPFPMRCRGCSTVIPAKTQLFVQKKSIGRNFDRPNYSYHFLHDICRTKIELHGYQHSFVIFEGATRALSFRQPSDEFLHERKDQIKISNDNDIREIPGGYIDSSDDEGSPPHPSQTHPPGLMNELRQAATSVIAQTAPAEAENNDILGIEDPLEIYLKEGGVRTRSMRGVTPKYVSRDASPTGKVEPDVSELSLGLEQMRLEVPAGTAGTSRLSGLNSFSRKSRLNVRSRARISSQQHTASRSIPFTESPGLVAASLPNEPAPVTDTGSTRIAGNMWQLAYDLFNGVATATRKDNQNRAP
jgi:hypothetical protein